MKFAAPIATVALAASTLASTARAEDIYITPYPPSELQRLAQESLIPISPKTAPSESEVRPDMRPIIGIDLTWREQQYFAQYVSGRDWNDRTPMPLASRVNTYTFHFEVGPVSSQNHYADEYSANIDTVPTPGALPLLGLGALAAARRMRR